MPIEDNRVDAKKTKTETKKVEKGDAKDEEDNFAEEDEEREETPVERRARRLRELRQLLARRNTTEQVDAMRARHYERLASGEPTLPV